MSVYTSVSRAELEAFLQHYPLGELVDFEGITAGIENTNFFVTTTQGDFVLTLFEVLQKDDLPYYLQLMAYLNEHDIPCAHPVADDQNQYVHVLNGKPATIMQRLQGQSVLQPDEQHCRAMGETLARMHLAGKGFPLRLANSRGEQWRQTLGKQLLPMINEPDARILQQELDDQASQPHHGLPGGAIHADLFRDNALFMDHRVSGIVDFYNACDDDLIYDVAITVNDWCVDQNGSLVFARAAALCHAYHAVRPLCEGERRAWPLMLRRAALRFWLSRLWDWHHPKSGELTFRKDPDAFKDILLARRQENGAAQNLWPCR
jgi:homoserine kinase type II